MGLKTFLKDLMHLFVKCVHSSMRNTLMPTVPSSCIMISFSSCRVVQLGVEFHYASSKLNLQAISMKLQTLTCLMHSCFGAMTYMSLFMIGSTVQERCYESLFQVFWNLFQYYLKSLHLKSVPEQKCFSTSQNNWPWVKNGRENALISAMRWIRLKKKERAKILISHVLPDFLSCLYAF